ncbi:universal stress protein [Bacteroidia bacterium]|nr:universal stress protein [Bacteroidia bacterium]
MKSILLPLEDFRSTRQKVLYCAEIASRFGATIHVLGTSKRAGHEAENRVQLYVRQAERFLVQKGVKYTVQIDFGVDVPAKLLSYSKEVKAGLIMIMADEESTGVFRKSCSEELVAQSKVPVMVVHSKDTRIAESSGY